MEQSIFGGRAYSAIFRVTDDHTSIANATTGVAIGTPALSDAAIILKDDSATENIVESSDITFDDAGVPSIKIASTLLDLVAFLQVAAPRKTGAAAVGKNEKTSEYGTKIGGAASGNGNPNYVLIHAGGVSGSDILTACIIGTVKPSSGSRSHKAGDVVMPSFEFTGVACKKTGGLVLDQALFDPTIWGTIGAALRTIGKDWYIQEALMPKAA